MKLRCCGLRGRPHTDVLHRLGPYTDTYPESLGTPQYCMNSEVLVVSMDAIQQVCVGLKLLTFFLQRLQHAVETGRRAWAKQLSLLNIFDDAFLVGLIAVQFKDKIFDACMGQSRL